jgi:GntR family transcriptional regulator, carbon starvation induced regulator
MVAGLELEENTKTITEAIVQRVRADILCCRLKPGDKLRVEKLRSAYGVGGSPVREALSRLTSVGLVRAEGQRGFTVAEVSTDDLLDLTRTRIWVETTALRSAIKDGDRNWEAEIMASAHRLGGNQPKISAEAGLEPEWEKKHRDFHLALVRGCNSSRLMHLRDQLNDLSDRYRHISVASGVKGRNPASEHKALMSAVLDRDANTACRLIADHFLETSRLVLVGTGTPTRTANATIEQLRQNLLV